MAAKPTSPAASGPAGANFEAQVGAYYLLAMLTGAAPRGLAGYVVERVEFQRGSAGRPLDDLVVHARNERGDPAILEIQAKRTISFSAIDPVFTAVVQQVAEASQRADFWSTRYELAVATARSSAKIDGPYQQTLAWARAVGSSAAFAQQINQVGSSSDDRRLCAILQTIHAQKPIHSDQAERRAVDEILAALVRLGVPQAAELEGTLRKDYGA